jgi:hypothetical protein
VPPEGEGKGSFVSALSAPKSLRWWDTQGVLRTTTEPHERLWGPNAVRFVKLWGVVQRHRGSCGILYYCGSRTQTCLILIWGFSFELWKNHLAHYQA